MKPLHLYLLCSILLATPCYADSSVFSARTCADWTEHRTISSSQSEVDEAWIVGYISGLSASADIDFIKVINIDSIKEWIDRYCETHPLKYLQDGGQALAMELVNPKR